MGKGSLRAYRTNQPKVRSFVAIDAHMRSAGPIGKIGKGRSKREQSDRQTVKAQLRRGDLDA
jgi:hypothetical protein